MKLLIIIAALLLLILQYRLWIGDSSLEQVHHLQVQIDKQRVENERLQQRNDILAAEVNALKSGLDAVEERAREDLGMIKKGETFYMMIDKDEQ